MAKIYDDSKGKSIFEIFKSFNLLLKLLILNEPFLLILVKVFVESVDEDGKKIDLDLNNIKVTVTRTEYPVIILKRLTKLEISKYIETEKHPKTNKISSKSSPNIVKSNYQTRSKKTECSTEKENVIVKHTKRRNDTKSSYMTRSKKAKLAENTQLPQTEIIHPNEHLNFENVISIQKEAVTKAIVPIEFKINEVVWGKIRGWPHWPARIVSIEPRRYVVFWFNDYRKSTLYRTQVFKFHENFKEFSDKFETKIGLETAAKEALIYLAAQQK